MLFKSLVTLSNLCSIFVNDANVCARIYSSDVAGVDDYSEGWRWKPASWGSIKLRVDWLSSIGIDVFYSDLGSDNTRCISGEPNRKSFAGSELWNLESGWDKPLVFMFLLDDAFSTNLFWFIIFLKTSTLVPCLENKLLTRLSDSSSWIEDDDFLRRVLEFDKSTLIRGMGLLFSVTLTDALFDSFYSSSMLRSEFFLFVNYLTCG